MLGTTQAKTTLIVLLVGALLIDITPPDQLWLLIGLTAFGVANVLLTLPGTAGVRMVAIGGTLAALIGRRDGWPSLMVALAWLVWPPAFMVSWALSREARETWGVGGPGGAQSRLGLAALIAAVASASLAYRLIVAGGLQQTAALFVGIPTILAILVVFAVSPQTATGVACKAVTVGMLVSLLFLGEGLLCVLMSAPLFYGIAVVIAAVSNRVRGRGESPTATTMYSVLIVLMMVPMSLEGVSPATTFNRDELVKETRIVRAPAEDVGRAIFEPPRFDRPLPTYLRAGFPTAVASRIERGNGETRWVITLRGGELRLNGMEPRMGDLVLRLEETRPGFVRWRAVSDTSHTTHFLTWRSASVQWERIDDATTKVSWTFEYRRGLDPAWYFGPMERYAVRLAARFLIDAVATP